MASTVNLFNTGKSAIFANKAALATTGHNIANVNTEGYSRQRVELSAADPIKLGSSVFGSGVRLDNVGRVTDDYLNKQINQEQKILGFSEESDIHLKHLESIFNEVNGVGMNNLISRFFNEFRKLANEPNDDALRASVRESAIQVVGDFKRINLQLDGIRHNIDARIDGYVREVNGYCDQVAQLNDQVKRLELTGGSANDIKDKRDLVLKKLSDVLDINVAEGDRGAVQVNLAGVGTLVSGNKSNHIKAEPTPPDYERGKEAGSLDLTLEGATYPEITTKMKSSKIGALTTLRDGQIYSLREKMDEMAYVLLKSVNMVHSVGFGKDGVNGRNFFQDLGDSRGASQVIDISDDIKKSLNAIAAGMDSSGLGDNRVAIALSKLADAKLMNGGRSSIDEHFNAAISELAVFTNKNSTTLEHQKDIVEQLNKFRESISGVSLDEETTKLVQYQHAMNASSKALKVADEILQVVLNLKN